MKKFDQLLAVAIGDVAFVYEKPLMPEIDSAWIEDYKRQLKDVSGFHISSSTLLEIIRNKSNYDTLNWKDAELSKNLLVKQKYENIDLRYPIEKFHLRKKKEIKYYRQLLDQYNKAMVRDRIVYSYSRPVFDNSGTFAVIQWAKPKFGSGLMIYHYENNKWKEIGNIEVTRI